MNGDCDDDGVAVIWTEHRIRAYIYYNIMRVSHGQRTGVYTRKPLVDDPCAHGTEETAAGSIYRRAPLWRYIGVKRRSTRRRRRRRRLPRQSVLRVPPPSSAFFYYYASIIRKRVLNCYNVMCIILKCIV